jgi:hypothetical protein
MNVVKQSFLTSYEHHIFNSDFTNLTMQGKSNRGRKLNVVMSQYITYFNVKFVLKAMFLLFFFFFDPQGLNVMELQSYMKQVTVFSDIISSITHKLAPHYRQTELHIYIYCIPIEYFY